MKFEFHVLNYNHNKRQVELFNIFDNIHVQEWTEKAIRKYLRSPSKYKYDGLDVHLTGFAALCEEILTTIAWQERGRMEYEISVGYAFEQDCSKLEKWDCYDQCKKNIDVIARECIYQYKQYLKEKKNGIDSAKSS